MSETNLTDLVTAARHAALAGKTLAIYLPNFNGGGAERLHINLAPSFRDAGMKVTYILDREEGVLLAERPRNVATVILHAHRQIAALPALIRYLRREKPDILLSNIEHANIMCIMARFLSGASTRLVACQHNAFSRQARRKSLKWRVLPFFYRLLLQRADAIVAVSAGVGQDLAYMTGLPTGTLTVIHNGVVRTDPAPPVAKYGMPTIVAVGRLVVQKDYPTLLQAFARLHDGTRLLILGEGPEKPSLLSLVERLGISSRVSFLGFVPDPRTIMAAAHVCVLSSRFEGFGNVLAEALALGTPCVSTDCPYGPSEILGRGEFGALVPVGDVRALAKALRSVLSAPPDPALLRRRGLDFSIPVCADAYLDLFAGLLAAPDAHAP